MEAKEKLPRERLLKLKKFYENARKTGLMDADYLRAKVEMLKNYLREG
jgi:hypothetical protein